MSSPFCAAFLRQSAGGKTRRSPTRYAIRLPDSAPSTSQRHPIAGDQCRPLLPIKLGMAVEILAIITYFAPF
jgi:hypothetical protein